jgi:hypothetical protein
MSTWPVFVQDWQLECCGEPFEIGDEVTWTLVFLTDPAFPAPEEMLIETDLETERVGTTEDGANGATVRVGDEFHAWLAGEAPGARRFAARGMLIEEHHGGVPRRLPPTRGVVRRIRLVTEDYRNASGVAWEPVRGSARYEDVARTPDSFVRSDLDVGGAVHAMQTGLLVDLELVPA